METKRGWRRACGAVMAMGLLLILVAPASVRADTGLTPQQQAVVDRTTVGLVARGLPLVAVLSFSVAWENCYNNYVPFASPGACIQEAAVANNIPIEAVLESTGATGRWSVYFGVCDPQCSNYRTGKINVSPSKYRTPSGDLHIGPHDAHLTYTRGGTADLTLIADLDGDYSFDWANSFGQGGTGYLVWNGPCFLYGFYFDTFDATNTGIVVMRRC